MIATNLRLLGWYRTVPFTSLHELMGLAWIGIWLNIFSGLSVFLTRPAGYLSSTPFLLKMGFIALGIAILVHTRKVFLREASTWDGEPSPVIKQLAMASLAFWVLAVIAGRLIAYVDVS